MVKNNKDFKITSHDSIFKSTSTFKFRLLKFSKNNADSGFMQIGPTESQFANGPKLKYMSMEFFYSTAANAEAQYNSLKTNLAATYKMETQESATTFSLSNTPYPKLILVKNAEPVPQLELIFFGEKR